MPATSAHDVRETLAAVVLATASGGLPEDGGFARAGLRRRIAEYVAGRRASNILPEQMLLELKKLVEPPTARLDPQDRRRVVDQLIAWAIEAYYGAVNAPADRAQPSARSHR